MTHVLEWPDLVTLFQHIRESMHMMNALTRKLNRKTEIEENFIIKCTVVFQSLSRVLVTPWTAACQASLSFTLSRSCVKLMSIKWVMLLNHLILCHPLLLLHSNFLSIRVFSIELALHIRWPRTGASASVLGVSVQGWFLWHWLVWSLCCPRDSQVFFRHHSSKTSIFWCSAFFMVQLSHPYMTAGKTVVLIIQTFVSKVMCLFFSMLSSFVIAFLKGASIF